MFVEDYGASLIGASGTVFMLQDNLLIAELRQHDKQFELFFMGECLATINLFGNIIRVEMTSYDINAEDSSYNTAVNDQTNVLEFISEAIIKGVRAIENWKYAFKREDIISHFRALCQAKNIWIL